MRIGLYIDSTYPDEDAPRVGARHLIERCVLGEQLGFDSLFLGDHHVLGRPYYQNVPMLGRLLAHWGPRTAGALFLLSLWPPVLLAEQIGTLAALSGAPFVLQCALGGGDHQFAGMNVARRERRPRFERHLDVVRRLLEGDPMTIEVKGREEQVQIAPVPAEPVEVWIGAHGEPAIDRAARLGDAWYSAPRHSLAELRSLLDTYVRACHRHGARPTCLPLRRAVHVAADQRELARVAARVRADGHRGFDVDALVIGTHGQVVDELGLLAEVGFTDVLCRQIAPDHADALTSLERLADVRRAVAHVKPPGLFDGPPS